MTLRHILLSLLLMFFILVIIVFLGVYRTITRPFPQTEGTLTVAGLSAPVTIRRNADGVPAITASTTEDLFFAQGFVHAQDRLFHMDVQRREHQSIEGDFRRTGLITRALRRLTEADARLPVILEAYSQGVNAYVASAPALPIEYQWMGKAWEPWVPEDSLVIVELYGQAVRRATPYQRTWRLADSSTVLPQYALVQSLSVAPATLLTPWYVNRLDSSDYQATGVSLMGVPMIVTGMNGEIAWMWQRVRECPEDFATIPFTVEEMPSPVPMTVCDMDLVSWFTTVEGYNRNAPIPLSPAFAPPAPTTWIDTRMSGAASASIVALLGQDPPAGMASFQQTDESAVTEWVVALNSVSSDNIIIQRAQEQLAAWNGEMRSDLPGATLYRVARAFTLHEMLTDEVGNDLAMAYLAETNGDVVDPLLDHPDHLLWDDTRTPDTESRNDIIARAWEQAHDYLGRRFGDVPHEWAWGRLHYATFRHPLADRFPILDRLLTRTVPLAGNATTIIPIPEDSANDFAPLAIPSLRVILSPNSDFYFAYPGGQSTHPFHPQSNTFLDAWATGDLLRLEWNGEHEAVLELVDSD